MDLQLNDKTALVTGASRGFSGSGEAIAGCEGHVNITRVILSASQSVHGRSASRLSSSSRKLV